MVEVKDFEFFPNDITINVGDTIDFIWTGVIPHSVTSDEPAGSTSFNSGVQAEGYQFQLIITSEGFHPYYCIPHGAPNNVGMAGTITAITDCNEGLVLSNISFINSGGSSSGFSIFVDGNLQNPEPITYSGMGYEEISLSLSGDGISHSLKVEDAIFNNCMNQIEYIAPDCSSNNCELQITNHSLSPCTESEVNIELTFTSINSGSSYNIYLDGNLYNDTPISYSSDSSNIASILLSGNGTNRNIVIVDSNDFSCTDTIDIEVPQCGDPCLISNFKIKTVPGLQRVEIRDFEFFPKEVEIMLGDTLRFNWVGSVEHTTTSDITSGVNHWDTGLLGQGATYDLVITEPGLHPYYCIPHGGPGGIGMAGTISVKDSCDGEFWATELTFDVQNGSILGYYVYIDGVQIGHVPCEYENNNGSNTKSINIPGDGNLHTVTVQDIETDFCASSAIEQSPICGAGCSIKELQANLSSNIVHIVEVRDFDFSPREIDVKVGETVRFKWVGTIPHTTTSDAIEGTDAWDSDLLGFGETYDVIITTPGVHPYYCIPHGGPGGIGMSGIINATPECVNGMVDLEVLFESTNGSEEGYNLFINGIQYNEELIQYQDPRGQNKITLQIPGDGENHVLTIQDFMNPICASSKLFQSTSCGTSCKFSDLQIDYSTKSVVEVEVRDFEFFPKNIIVERGDTLRFFWTGVIPHTVTSDSTSGEVVFNSNLLETGATYDLVINHEGIHPYYCIPHGSPGGIGMSGTIEVVSPCADEFLNTTALFIAENGGTVFNATLDGNSIQGSPFNYLQGGQQSFDLNIPGDGMEHILVVSDAQNSECNLNKQFTAPDCDDPCFDLISDFEYEKTTNPKVVQFFEKAIGGASSWEWDFADGNLSTERNPMHSYEEGGSYNVCLSVTNAENQCIKTYCNKVNIGGYQCEGDFDYLVDGLIVHYTNTSLVSDSNTVYNWDFGDNSQISNETSPSYEYPTPGLYNVCLSIENDSCFQTICQEIDLTNVCTSFNADFDFTIDETNSLEIHFQDKSEGKVDNWLWGFGDGITSNDQNPSHAFSEKGIFNICLLVQDTINKCNSSLCKSVSIGTTAILDNTFDIFRLKIYPNPALKNTNHWLIDGINNETGLDELEYQIIDINGRIVTRNKVTNSGRISIPNKLKQPGLYILRIFGKRQIYQGTLVLQ
jgi:plastocyanin/PKD repeat protein